MAWSCNHDYGHRCLTWGSVTLVKKTIIGMEGRLRKEAIALKKPIKKADPMKIQPIQLRTIYELADKLNKDISHWKFNIMTFEQAHKAIAKLKDDLAEHERLKQIVTESEVRARLKRYNDDDALYDAKIARPSQISVSHTTDVDTMSRMIHKIIKRCDLERAIRGALLPANGESASTKRQKQEVKHKRRLYRLIRLIYVFEQGISGAALLCDLDRGNVCRYEQEAVCLITEYLNAQAEKQKPFRDMGQA